VQKAVLFVFNENFHIFIYLNCYQEFCSKTHISLRSTTFCHSQKLLMFVIFKVSYNLVLNDILLGLEEVVEHWYLTSLTCHCLLASTLH
jgi:hypothetical protein